MSETRILLWKMTNGSIKDEENWKRNEQWNWYINKNIIIKKLLTASEKPIHVIDRKIIIRFCIQLCEYKTVALRWHTAMYLYTFFLRSLFKSFDIFWPDFFSHQFPICNIPFKQYYYSNDFLQTERKKKHVIS